MLIHSIYVWWVHPAFHVCRYKQLPLSWTRVLHCRLCCGVDRKLFLHHYKLVQVRWYWWGYDWRRDAGSADKLFNEPLIQNSSNIRLRYIGSNIVVVDVKQNGPLTYMHQLAHQLARLREASNEASKPHLEVPFLGGSLEPGNCHLIQTQLWHLQFNFKTLCSK